MPVENTSDVQFVATLAEARRRSGGAWSVALCSLALASGSYAALASRGGRPAADGYRLAAARIAPAVTMAARALGRRLWAVVSDRGNGALDGRRRPPAGAPG
jgi:hypothetical protein